MSYKVCGPTLVEILGLYNDEDATTTTPKSAAAKTLSAKAGISIRGSRRLLPYSVWCGEEDQGSRLTLECVCMKVVTCFP